MTITITQKIIKIGTSRGVTIPAKELKTLGVEAGDELELTVRRKSTEVTTDELVKTANSLLDQYKQDFTNLANR